MPVVSDAGVTELLNAWSNGDNSALEKLTPLILNDLRRIAKRQLRRERSGHSMLTSDLIGEVYLRLVGMRKLNWKDRAQFFALSATLIRHILVDAARARRSRKRGGDVVKVPLEEALMVQYQPNSDLVMLDDALTNLAAVDPRKVRVVELRYFGGLSVKETAVVLGVSPNTVLMDWKLAKAWLWQDIKGKKAHDA